MVHGSSQHVRDRFDAAVGVPRKPGGMVVWIVVPKIVQQQEGIELSGVTEPKRAAQLHAGTFERGL